MRPEDGFYWIRTKNGYMGYGPWELVTVHEGETYLCGTDTPLWPRDYATVLEWRRIAPPTD